MAIGVSFAAAVSAGVALSPCIAFQFLAAVGLVAEESAESSASCYRRFFDDLLDGDDNPSPRAFALESILGL
jgi:hypothetical protein